MSVEAALEALDRLCDQEDALELPRENPPADLETRGDGFATQYVIARFLRRQRADPTAPQFIACSADRHTWLVRWPSRLVKHESAAALAAKGFPVPDVPLVCVMEAQ